MNKNLVLISLFIISIISIFYWTLKPKNELYDAKWNAPDTTLAITINGEISTSFPATNAYTGTVECTTGTGKVEWNGSKWVLTASGIEKGSTKCNATFITRVSTLTEALLANNEVQTPITTPGSEVSAYKIDDVSTSLTSSASSEQQSYFITYGTGWKANGTNFDLTGAKVTSSTYANSYSSLVGKYLPYPYISSSSSGGSGSSTAGTMVTTTDLTNVYYVISATSSTFTYKTLGSNKNTTEALLASTPDDYGTSYYFRGTVKNNYVDFANKCWRIVRVGGDGSVKLILHNDNITGVANPCDSANNSDSAAFARYSGTTYTSAFNTNYNDNTYVGFMYGQAGASDYATTHANTNKSTILNNLEIWYNNNLKTYESLIDNNVFCNDKGRTGIWPGYGTELTFYDSGTRLSTSGTPSLKCNGNLSKITGKVGLITADEAAFACFKTTGNVSLNYLLENTGNALWWTMTPAGFYGDAAQVWAILSGLRSMLQFSVDNENGFRPYISLKASASISGGSGTSEDPYLVKYNHNLIKLPKYAIIVVIKGVFIWRLLIYLVGLLKV